jgi:FixJ family two-component response regulator
LRRRHSRVFATIFVRRAGANAGDSEKHLDQQWVAGRQSPRARRGATRLAGFIHAVTIIFLIDRGLLAMPQNAVSRGEVFVMDDDVATRAALTLVLQEEGYEVICFADGAALLSEARVRVPACIFLEARIPGKSSLDILRKLRAKNYPAPVVIISEEANIPMAVEAMRNGARDFIEKPFYNETGIAQIKAALGALAPIDGVDGRSIRPSRPALVRVPLTGRERDVLAQLAEGASNKEAARQLGVSARTVEGHRANIMKKFGARNARELMRCILGASLGADSRHRPRDVAGERDSGICT